MFCFPQMGIIGLFGSWADSSDSRRGLGVGGPGAAGSAVEQKQVGISFCHMEEKAVGQFLAVM